MAYIHQITNFDIHNDFGEGPTVSMFVNYCSFRCLNCWNSDTWDRKPELYMDNEDVVKLISTGLDSRSDMGMHKNLSILGGDPIVDDNIDDTIAIIKKIKTLHPDVRIAIWTGYDVDSWIKNPDQHVKRYLIMQLVDWIIDGPYVEKLKTKHQMFGSFNQRVINTNTWLESQNTMKSLRPDYIETSVYSIHTNKTYQISDLISEYTPTKSYLSYLLGMIKPHLKEL